MTLSYDAGTFTLETREGTFEFVGRDMGKVTKTVIEDIAYQLLTIISMCATIYMLA